MINTNLEEIEMNLTDSFDTVYIVDKQYNDILAHIPKNMIFVPYHIKDKQTGISQFGAEIIDHPKYAEYLSNRNRLIVPGEDGKWLEFRIEYTDKFRDSNGVPFIEIIAFETYHDLAKSKVIDPFKINNTAEWHTNNALSGIKHKVGTIDYKGSKTIEFEDATDPYNYLRKVAKEFDLELDFYIKVEGTKISHYVDLLEQVGEDRGRVVEHGRDLQSLRRTEDSSKVVTALMAYGPEREDGTRLSVFVEDRDALARWGENGNEHIIEAYYPQSERTEMTLEELTQYARTELNKRINTVATYEANVVDLENMPGMENKKLRFGDTIGIKDTEYNPPLYMQARVFYQKREVFNREPKEIKLGDYVELTEEEVNEYWNKIRDEINKRMDRMPVVKINSSKGNVFKNDEGETTLYVNTFVDGKERDEDETFYTYLWKIFDKDGNEESGVLPSGKEIEVSSNQIDEKAVYRIEVRLNNETVGTDEITIYSVSDGKDGTDGTDGKDGEDGKTLYTWIRYADTPTSGISGNPEGKKYIGIAENMESQTPSNHYADYVWSKYTGEDGIPGEPGEDGETTYTWVRYADDENGTNMSDNPADKSYIGLAFNKTEQTPSNDPEDYTWSKIKGDDAHVTENLISNLPRNWEQGLFSPVNGNPAPNNNAVRTKDFTEIDPNEDYTLSLHHDVGTKTLLVNLYDDNKNFIKNYNGNSITFYADGARYIRVAVVSQTRLRPEQVGRDVRVLLEVGSNITNWEIPKEDTPYAMEMAKDIILFDDGTGVHIKHDEIVFGDYDGSEIVPIATIKRDTIKSKDELVIDSPKIRFENGYVIEFEGGPSIDTEGGSARLRASQGAYVQVFPDGRFNVLSPGAVRTFSVSPDGNLNLRHANTIGFDDNALAVFANRIDGDSFKIITHEDNLSQRTDFYIRNNGIPFFPQIWDTANSTNTANVRVGSNGALVRTTSSKEFKLVAGKVSSNPYDLLKLDVLDWYDLHNTEKYAELLTKKLNGEDISEELKDIENLRRIPGVFAEDVERIGLEQFVEYDNDGKTVGVMETRLPLLLIPIVKDLKEENEQLKERLNNLEERLSELENN